MLFRMDMVCTDIFGKKTGNHTIMIMSPKYYVVISKVFVGIIEILPFFKINYKIYVK